MISLLEEAFPDAFITLTSPDSVHYALEIYTEAFRELSLLEQQRSVARVLKNYIGLEVHAMSMKTGVHDDREN